MKFLFSFFTLSLLLTQSIQAAESPDVTGLNSRPVVNCQIQGYEAQPENSPRDIKKFPAKARLITASWEACFKEATVYTRKFPFKQSSSGVFSSTTKYRLYKWIFRHVDGHFISGIITKHTDSHIDFPEEGSLLFDQSGFLLDIDTSRIE